jgi:hypothetical protein
MQCHFRARQKLLNNPKLKRRPLLPALLLAVGAACPATIALADPTLPTIGSANYDVTVSDPAIGTSAVIETGTTSTVAANNTTVINDYLAYAAANGGGTVVIPTGTYDSNEILLTNNTDLDIQTGATLVSFNSKNTLVNAAAGTTGNVEISGGGILNNAATSTSNNKMVQLDGLNNVEVNNITIENAPNEHLVSECCNNVTFNNITIQDPLKIQANTDGIDFSGTNYLVENCNISDGDDDIVAKPNTDVFNGITAFTSNVIVNNCTITAGHGISIGGQTNEGLNGMYVSNINMAGSANNPFEYGIHLKAGDGNTANTENGGPVNNVTFNNITMTNVADALLIDSYYQNGNNYPSGHGPFPTSPTDSTEPLWSNITFENMTISAPTGSASKIYGLNSTPPNLVGFNAINLNITSEDSWYMYYATNVYISGVTVNGTAVANSLVSGGKSPTEEFADTFDSTPGFIYVPTVPEPASISLIGGLALALTARRRRRGPWNP